MTLFKNIYGTIDVLPTLTDLDKRVTALESAQAQSELAARVSALEDELRLVKAAFTPEKANDASGKEGSQSGPAPTA